LDLFGHVVIRHVAQHVDPALGGLEEDRDLGAAVAWIVADLNRGDLADRHAAEGDRRPGPQAGHRPFEVGDEAPALLEDRAATERDQPNQDECYRADHERADPGWAGFRAHPSLLWLVAVVEYAIDAP
jgi:hypothetical protein